MSAFCKVLFSLVALLWLAPPVSATVLCNQKIDLVSSITSATGTAKVLLVTGNNGVALQKFQFSVELGVAETTFKLFVDGNEIGSFTTDEAGSAEAVLNNQKGVLPPTLNPVCNIHLVEIRDANGNVVLMGSFA